jgi:hypothetical protein
MPRMTLYAPGCSRSSPRWPPSPARWPQRRRQPRAGSFHAAARSPIQLEVTRNATTNAGQNTPYQQRLNLMGYLE